MNEINVLMVGIPHEMIQNWGWFMALGIGLGLLGIAALVRSVKATVISMSFFGWLLLIAAGHRDCAGFHSRKLGRLFPAFAGCGSIRSNRRTVCLEAGDQRRGCDPFHGHVLPYVRAVSTGRLADDSPAGLGLACAERNYHRRVRGSRTGAMADLRPVGDRPFCRNRSAVFRLGLDRAGA